MALLMTGGAGFIGANVAHLAVEGGHEVVVVDDLRSGCRDNVPRSAVFRQGDAGSAAVMADLLCAAGCTAVLHFAGAVFAAESMADPLAYYAANTAGLIGLLEACAASGVTRFLLSSSAAVYGDRASWVAENAATAPVSPYGRSKLMAEQILCDAVRATGARAIVLRYFNVAGADPEGRAGPAEASAPPLVQAAGEVALGRRSALAIHGDDWPTPDGTGVRDYVHVHDLARAHLLAIKRLEQVAPGSVETYNLGAGCGRSVREVAAAISRAGGFSLPCRVGPRRPGDVAALVADISRARDVLNWTPRFSLEDTAAHALAWARRSRAPGEA